MFGSKRLAAERGRTPQIALMLLHRQVIEVDEQLLR